MTLKELVAQGKKARFSFWRNDICYYITDDGFEFPVPTSDTVGVTLLAEDKAIFFMRWIRKHLELGGAE